MYSKFATASVKAKVRSSIISYNCEEDRQNDHLFLSFHYNGLLYSWLHLPLIRICERMFWNSSTIKIYVFTFRHPAKSPLTMDGCFFVGGLGTIRSRDSPSQQYLSLEIGIDQENQRTLRNSVDDTESLLDAARPTVYGRYILGDWLERSKVITKTPLSHQLF